MLVIFVHFCLDNKNISRKMRNTGTVRVAVVQCSSVILNVSATVTKLEKYAKEAAEKGAKLVVFPEAFISCYPRGTNFGVIVGSRSPVHPNFASNLRFSNTISNQLTGGTRKVSKILGIICRRSWTCRG